MSSNWMPSRDEMIDLEVLCQVIQAGGLPEVSLDRYLTLEELRAALGSRAEARFGTVRQQELVALLHSSLWPAPPCQD